VVERALAWLDTPHPAVAVELYPSHQDEVWLGGSSITYTLELRNRGQSTDRFDLTLSPSGWPASVWDGDFSQPIDQSIALSGCQTQTLGIEITVPSDVMRNSTDVVTLTARSQSKPAHSATAAFHSKAPAPILLVDDHRWYDTLDDYRSALEANSYPYDVWRIDPNLEPEEGSPSLRRLRSYPVVLWFTAYDWHSTLAAHDEAQLATYLAEGGRLLLSSQDYLYTNGLTEFANQYLGVASYTEDLTATQISGAVGNPVGNGLAAMDLDYPFGNWTDALRPAPSVSIAFWGQHGQPVALNLAGPESQAGGNWKSSFFAIPLEALQALDRATVVGQTVDWLSALGDSRLLVDRAVADEGEELAYALQIRNTGPVPLNNVSLTNDLPDHTSYVAGSLEGPAVYEPGRERFIWQGLLSPGQTIGIGYRLRLDARVPDGTWVRSVANLSDESGLAIERVATSRVAMPDLSGSAKVASHERAHGGQVLSYTLHLRNQGLHPAQATLIDPIPPLSSYLPGSAWTSDGQVEASAERLLWSGSIRAEEAVTLGFQVIVSPTAASLYAYNRASLEDGEGNVYPLEAASWVEARALLPFVARQE
jgi:uncharacterized repeat protein (TIGR01451 family)